MNIENNEPAEAEQQQNVPNSIVKLCFLKSSLKSIILEKKMQRLAVV